MHIFTVQGAYSNDVIGGAEIQLQLLEDEFIRKGHKVSRIHAGRTNQNFPFIETKKGINIYHVFPEKISDEFFYFKRLERFLKKHVLDKADIIYTREYHNLFILNKFSKAHNIPLVYLTPSDDRCVPIWKSQFITKNYISSMRKFISDLMLPDIDCLVSQTKNQSRLVRKHFNIKSTIISNGHHVSNLEVAKLNKVIVSWIANIKAWKQPEIFIKLAERCLDLNVHFIYAGAAGSPKIQKPLDTLTNELPNITYLGKLSFNDCNLLLAYSSLFINTSLPKEGFPNTYIQAWNNKTPVVALNFDPDDVLKNEKIGLHSGNFEKLVKDVRFLIKRREIREEMGLKAKYYSNKNHDIKSIGKNYLKLFEDLIEKKSNPKRC